MEKNRSPKLCDPLICTGCAACRNACPQEAIKMEPGIDGFLRPVIDPDQCIKCLLCEKACPVLISSKSSNEDKPEVLHVGIKIPRFEKKVLPAVLFPH